MILTFRDMTRLFGIVGPYVNDAKEGYNQIILFLQGIESGLYTVDCEDTLFYLNLKKDIYNNKLSKKEADKAA